MVERALFTTQVPVIVQDPDTGGVTLGVRWFSDQPGQVVAIRFYKGGAQGGNSHTVRLYNAAGAILATAVSSGETSAGWQRVNLAAPVPVAADTEYRAAVFWPAGRYPATNNFFAAQHNNPPLHAYATSNGVYAYAASMGFPTSTWQASNYFVDPIVEIEAASPPPAGFKTLGRGSYALREPQFVRPAAPPPPTGRVFYVATTGNDSNPGTQAQPWRNIGTAVGGPKNLQPGDTVIVMPGTYTEQVWFSDGGEASGYVALRSQIKHGALVRPPSGTYSTINLQASYTTVDGFDVVGGSGHGIAAEASSTHHIRILNNLCHDSGGSGISCVRGEFYTIDGNICHGNSNTSGFHTSGISIYQSRGVAGDTTTSGFRNIVRNNVCYNNIEISTPGDHTDGNGIIIDDFNNTQGGGEPGGYIYPTLVENNLCYDNGSKGIQVTWSNFVMIRNNTCFHNNKDNLNRGTWRAELSNQMCNDNTWVNNIGWANPIINSNNLAIRDGSVSGGNVNVVWYNNLTYNGNFGTSILGARWFNKSDAEPKSAL